MLVDDALEGFDGEAPPDGEPEALTAQENDELMAALRDVLGLREAVRFSAGDAQAVVLEVPRATIEVGNACIADTTSSSSGAANPMGSDAGAPPATGGPTW